MATPTERVLVIGLDGYDPELGQRWMDEGHLPALALLAGSSAVVPLEHGEAKRTGLAWEHFASGKDPHAENRFSAVNFDANTYECTQRGTTATPFMQPFARECVIFDAPYLDLTRTSGARGLVAWGAHDPGVPEHSAPSGLANEVREKFGAYPATHWIYGHTWPSVSDTAQMGRDLVAATNLRAEITNWMFRERFPDWRLAITVISELHSATEALWHGVDPDHPLKDQPSADPARQALFDVYQAVDRFVADVTQAHPDATIVACTMHGMGANHSDLTSMALLSELMYRRQFGQPLLQFPQDLSTIVPPEQELWTDSVRRYLPQADVSTEAHVDAAQPVRTRHPIVQRVRNLAKQVLMPIRHQRVRTTLDWMPANWYAPHWPQMAVFALPSFYDGQLRVNLRGRERCGVVEADAYTHCLDDIEALLGECRDALTGEAIVLDLVRSHRTDPLEMGPSEADLIIVWNDAVAAFTHPDHGTVGPLPFRRPGGHTGGNGMAWICGPGLNPGSYALRSAFDLVPTIVEALGHRSSNLSGASFWRTVTER